MKVRIVRAAALLLTGIYAGGVLFGVLAPRLYELPGPAYVRWWQALNLDYGRAMPVLLLSCVALLIATSAFSARRGRFVLGLAVVATVFVAASVVLTVTQMEPLNRLADSWDPDALPADWIAARDSWQGLHLARTALATVAFALLLASQVLDTGAPSSRRSLAIPVAA